MSHFLMNKPTVANSYIVQEQPYEIQLFDYLTSYTQQSEVIEPTQVFRGSANGLCSRMNVLQSEYRRVKEYQAWLDLKSHIGTCTESWYVDKFSKMNVLVAHDVAIADNKSNHPYRKDDVIILKSSEQLGYAGTIDMVITDHEHELSILDIKTLGKVPDVISPTYISQVQFYCLMSGIDKGSLFIQPPTVKTGTENFNGKVVKINTSKTALLNLAELLFYSRLCIEHGVVPKRDTKFRKSVECNYCMFKQECYDNEDLATTRYVPINDKETMELQVEAECKAIAFVNEMPNRKKQFLKGIKTNV